MDATTAKKYYSDPGGLLISISRTVHSANIESLLRHLVFGWADRSNRAVDGSRGFIHLDSFSFFPFYCRQFDVFVI